MQEYESCARKKKCLGSPGHWPGSKTLTPDVLSQREAGLCPSMQDLGSWSDGCPQSIALGSAEFPTPAGERIIPFVCPDLFLTKLCCWLFITSFSSRR